MALTAAAQDFTTGAELIPGKMISRISPNANWAINNNQMDNVFEIINFESGDTWRLEVENEYSDELFDMGTGNCVSNTGIILISTTYGGTASYWENGEVKHLPVKETDLSAFSNGITPDGKRICGTIGIEMSMDATEVMQKPVIWNLKEDGTYDEYVKLPYPDKDWTGRLPQYVQAICISDDGKVIVGQITDYAGALEQPIVWREDAEGNWTYALVNPELINPNNVVLPEDPGECPQGPNYEDFLTEEALENYNNDCMNWAWDSGDEYPEVTDYMTEEMAAKYAEEKAANDALVEEWNNKSLAYGEALDEAISASKQFGMNSVFLSPNGRYYATNTYIGFMWIVEEVVPFVFDLETGEAVEYNIPEGKLIQPNFINNDGVMLASDPANDLCRSLYISHGVGEELVPFHEFMKNHNAEVYEWMEENCKHDMIGYDMDTYEEVVIPDVWTTGTAVADANFDKVYSWVSNGWDSTGNDPSCYTYIIPMAQGSGVKGTLAEAQAFTVKARKGGVLTIKGDADSVVIYDMQGRKVFQGAAAEQINTGLANGLYTVCVKGQGVQKVMKAVF